MDVPKAGFFGPVDTAVGDGDFRANGHWICQLEEDGGAIGTEGGWPCGIHPFAVHLDDEAVEARQGGAEGFAIAQSYGGA